MFRATLPCSLLAAVVAVPTLRADAFDNYTNPILAKVPQAKGALKVTRGLPSKVLIEHAGALPGTAGALLVVRTNEGRFAKLLVQPARQKVAGGDVPILLVDRYVTYKEGEERALQAQGKNLRLFDGFLLSLDVGGVVPAQVGGDLRFVVGTDGPHLEPVGKADLYIVTQNLPEVASKKVTRPQPGAAFEPRFFNGTYKVYDDGRRSGRLHLKVEPNGEVGGHYFSDKDGKKYEVEGKIGNPLHSIQFHITFPRTVQDFKGWLFTDDGRALTGFTRLQGRETGFYAVRVED
jgi:hypothetical protein